MQSRMVKVEFAQGFQRKMRGEHSSQRDLRAVPNNLNCGHKKTAPEGTVFNSSVQRLSCHKYWRGHVALYLV